MNYPGQRYSGIHIGKICMSEIYKDDNLQVHSRKEMSMHFENTTLDIYCRN